MLNVNTSTCPECGAPTIDGMTCWEQFGALLALEAHDPELLAVHFLTVAAYNLQHPAQFTDEAIAGLRASFIAHLDHGVSVATIRRRTAAVYDGKRRVLKPAADRQPVFHRWPMTVADVYLPEHPEDAAERVRQWAAAIRRAL